MKIAIIGLGYVGLPLALQFARRGVMAVVFWCWDLRTRPMWMIGNPPVMF